MVIIVVVIVIIPSGRRLHRPGGPGGGARARRIGRRGGRCIGRRGGRRDLGRRGLDDLFGVFLLGQDVAAGGVYLQEQAALVPPEGEQLHIAPVLPGEGEVGQGIAARKGGANLYGLGEGKQPLLLRRTRKPEP